MQTFAYDGLPGVSCQRGEQEEGTVALAHAIMTALIEDDLSGYELARDGYEWRKVPPGLD